MQSWSTLSALPVDFYLQPAEEFKYHYVRGNGAERGTEKNSLGEALTQKTHLIGLCWWGREHFYEHSEYFRHWGDCPKGGLWKNTLFGGVRVTWQMLVSAHQTFALVVFWFVFCKHHSNKILWRVIKIHREQLKGEGNVALVFLRCFCCCTAVVHSEEDVTGVSCEDMGRDLWCGRGEELSLLTGKILMKGWAS